MRLRNIFAASRFVIGLAVIGSFVGSAILLVIATITLFRIAWNEIVNLFSQPPMIGLDSRLFPRLESSCWVPGNSIACLRTCWSSSSPGAFERRQERILSTTILRSCKGWADLPRERSICSPC